MIGKTPDPVACHKAIPVPLHWQAEVKEALDKAVQLAVIEAVPVGNPVTWWLVSPNGGGLQEERQTTTMRGPLATKPTRREGNASHGKKKLAELHWCV